MKRALIACLLLLLTVVGPAAAYTVYLKDGAKLIAKEPPEIRGGTAIIVLQNGTQTSLDASEIDLERTRQANQSDLGSALILEGGEFTDQPTVSEPTKETKLSDLISRNAEGRSASRSRSARSTGPLAGPRDSEAIDLLDWTRSPYRNLDVAGEIQGVFRGQGVEQTRLFQGTASDRVLIDLTTDSEAAVFRALKVAAGALVHLQSKYPQVVSSFELVLTTSNNARAGQFYLDEETAELLVSGDLETSSFFVANVRF